MRGFFAFAAGGLMLGAAALAQSPPRDLADPKSFDAIADRSQRSAALFDEAGKVILHPRCVNCHPAGDRPLQGANMHPHNPPVVRGPADIGAAGLGCGTCHLDANTPIVAASIRSVPNAWSTAVPVTRRGSTPARSARLEGVNLSVRSLIDLRLARAPSRIRRG